MPDRIFDVHLHFPRDWENPEADRAPLLENVATTITKLNVRHACLLTGGRFGPEYERGIELAQQYDDLFVPVAVVDPETTEPEDLDWLMGLGYRGLKIIGTARPYDEPDYWPIYGRAEQLGLPILFHLGVVGGGLDYARTHPRRDPEAARTYRRMQRLQRTFVRDMSAGRMSPLHLDTIASRFPDLKIIGAHLGNQGNMDYVASVARWRHHVWFDMSGGSTIEDHAEARNLIGEEIGIEKLVWGSDCAIEVFHEHIARFEALYDRLGLDDDARDRLWWRNAAEIYGFETPQLASE